MKINEMSVGATVSGSVAPAPSKMGKMKRRAEEAANPAQQAAIAVSMKKAGKKPKNLKEGSVKQLIMDLRELKDREFMKKYGKSKEEMKQGLKSQVDENFFDKITSFIGRPFDEKEIAKDLQNRGGQMNKSKSATSGGVTEGTDTKFVVTYYNNLSDDTRTVLVSADDEYDAKDKINYALGRGSIITDVRPAKGNEPTDQVYKVYGDPRSKVGSPGIYDRGQGVAEGEVTRTKTGLIHKATDKYGAGEDPEGFNQKYARDLTALSKSEVKRLDNIHGVKWKNRGSKGVAESAILQGMIEARVTEDELLLMPGQGIKFKPELMPKKSDHEVEMARSQLIAAAKDAEKIFHCIRDVSEIQGLDGWVQAKITKANDYLNSVAQYLEGKMIEQHEAVLEQNPPASSPSYMYSTKNYVNRDGEETFNRRTASIRPDSQGNTLVRGMDTSRELGDEMTINTTVPKGVNVRMVPQQGNANLEETDKESTQEKLHRRHQELRKKSGLPDPEYYRELKATYDMPDDERWAKTRELKNKYKVKEQETDPYYIKDQQPQQQEPKQGMDVRKGLGLLSTIGRALNTVTSPTFGDDVKADIRTMIHNKVTGTPNK